MGIRGHKVSGLWICTPPDSGSGILPGRIKGAANICRRRGADVVALSPGIDDRQLIDGLGIEVSSGCIYRPSALIDGVRAVSSLMGIDFKRCGVCVADASTHIGMIVSELLSREVSSLTLCTENRNTLTERIHGFILNTGLSAAVARNLGKAVSGCEILFYAGGCDTSALWSFIKRKTLIVNLTAEKISPQKNFLVIDDVLLRAEDEPTVSLTDGTADIMMTSRIWEGALLALCDFESGIPDEEKALQTDALAKSFGIRIVGAVRDGKALDNHTIYRYR